jgi:hypothetical protein
MANYYDEARSHLLKITNVEEDNGFLEENILTVNVKK